MTSNDQINSALLTVGLFAFSLTVTTITSWVVARLVAQPSRQQLLADLAASPLGLNPPPGFYSFMPGPPSPMGSDSSGPTFTLEEMLEDMRPWDKRALLRRELKDAMKIRDSLPGQEDIGSPSSGSPSSLGDNEPDFKDLFNAARKRKNPFTRAKSDKEQA